MDISTFQKRKSTRRFADTKIEDATLNELIQFVNQIPPLQDSTKRQLVWLAGKDLIRDTLSSFLLSYGKIVAAPYMLIPFYETSEDSDMVLGFEMEYLVLKAIELGIGSLWVSTEESKSSLLDSIQALHTYPGKWPEAKFLSKLPPNWETQFKEMELPVVLLFGYPSEKRLDRIINNAIRMESAGNSRKKIETLIINRRQSQLPENMKKILNLSILAPSKRNQQPWRVRINKDGFDVGYLHERKLDIGIFFSHIKIAMDALGLKYKLEVFTENSSEVDWKVKVVWK
jgi:nitroreductase